MLGKRPHQIQRTTSMSQLRVPPGARTRAIAPPPRASDAAAHGRKQQMPSETMHGAQMNSAIASSHKLGTDTVSKYGSSSPHDPAQKDAHDITSVLQVVSSAPVINLHARHHLATIAESFLEACYFCKRPLGHGRDIFMYRGDAAFCTEDCRRRKMSSDESGHKCGA